MEMGLVPALRTLNGGGNYYKQIVVKNSKWGEKVPYWNKTGASPTTLVG